MAPSKSSKASSASAGAKRRSSSTSTATSSKAKTGSTLNSSFTASKASATSNAKKAGVTTVKEEVGSSSKTAPSSMTMTTGTTKELEEAKALQEEEKKLIKSYGKLMRESSRIMGTAIHDQDWLPLEVVLRVFDADPDYGPCSNQSRLERFERAERLGLEPPSEIGAILRSKVGLARPEYRNSVFSGTSALLFASCVPKRFESSGLLTLMLSLISVFPNSLSLAAALPLFRYRPFHGFSSCLLPSVVIYSVLALFLL
ncbi:BZ3500_MvSof-1268-A1-R1_Chr10-1g02745 [Microbotryum saponariae]|uniref:BZ3500_MvSof-1268-A1-R1_Chr10-1g02745 protein n=1 Tax=Microbotryum saponariae TaxID=289078 RepID=A0A2X0N9C4_9BASI|nr:BZ3500_MvSof-1268-A1-R1_Chr10-1g02745 [Microbotryum saponariae]SDA06234.1 BZ3501_MvSof-1269-A2-R1_Chr10-1g02346 [Microbotryum saponariae]